MKAIVNRTAPFVHPVELPLKVHCLFQMKLFNMPATYPVKLDKPSRHPKSFIITPDNDHRYQGIAQPDYTILNSLLNRLHSYL